MGCSYMVWASDKDEGTARNGRIFDLDDDSGHWLTLLRATSKNVRVILSITYRARTYDHNHQKARRPVRSAIDKLMSAELVVGSVTTSESSVLYVFFFLFAITLDMLLNTLCPVSFFPFFSVV